MRLQCAENANGAIFAWLTMMYYGGAFYVLPRLLGLREMWSKSLAVALGCVWNIAFAAGVVTLALGYTRGREYTEFIWPLDVVIVAVLVLNTLMTMMNRRVKPLQDRSCFGTGQSAGCYRLPLVILRSHGDRNASLLRTKFFVCGVRSSSAP